MAKKPDIPQSLLTRKFLKNKEGAVSMRTETLCGPRPANAQGIESLPVITIHGGKRGYVWIGSRTHGCYTHVPLSSLKRLIASAEV